MKRLLENLEFAEMQHGEVILTLKCHRLMLGQREADVQLFVFYLSHGLNPTRGPTVPVGNEACRVSH